MSLTQLYPSEVNTSSHAVEVDIVAVHGLNPWSRSNSDHAWNTWRAPQGRLWLRDDLPEHVPKSRIFLYEYDSRAVYGKDKSTFIDKANELLEDIRLKRITTEKRPLLFLGHSLGGLLIKQALINAHNNEKYEAIKTATKGLAFFATPHYGGNATLVHIGGVAAKIAIGLGFKQGGDIVQTLDNGSIFSDIMHEHFRHRLLKFPIISFWGTEDTVVAKSSACFGLPGDRENVVSLRADHSQVCKFGTNDRDKRNLERVVGNIRDLYEEALKTCELNVTPPIIGQEGGIFVQEDGLQTRLAKLRPDHV